VGPGLELLALTAFVFARPVFGSLGRSPETFIARGADWTDVVGFGLIVVLAPVALALALELVFGLGLGERARRLSHVAGMALLFALAVWELGGSLTDWDLEVSLAVTVVLALMLTVLWVRTAPMATFLRYAAIGAAVFLVQFLALSPVSAIALGGRHAPGDIGDVGLGDDAPPVVLVVFDGLPTSLLLDGEGRIDPELYPNLAALAGDATWYRNHTTVAQHTLQAVPAILSGSQPSSDPPPAVASHHRNNIFTLLGSSHEIHGAEAITGLCPVDVCPEPPGSPLPGLMHDAGYVFGKQITDAGADLDLIPHVFWDRMGTAETWIEAQDFTPEGRPGLHVLHLLTPHPAWEYLPDGSHYAGSAERPKGLAFDTWSSWGAGVARQRHALQMQASDALLGDLLDRVRADGAYDDSLVVVTADHGYAFVPDAPWRGLHEDNFHDIMWTPLIVKAPGQTRGVVDDSNVNTLDILPTMAAELGVDQLPWETDGRPAGTVERNPADKWVADWSAGRLHPDDEDSDIVEVDGEEGFARVLASDPVEGTGPLAAWRRTDHGGLLGRDVADLEVGAPDDVDVAVADLEQWDDVDLDRPPLELVGHAPLRPDATVAVTVDGRVAATVPAERGGYGRASVHALLWPEVLSEGRNHIGMFRVEGPPSSPVLHELTVVPKSARSEPQEESALPVAAAVAGGAAALVIGAWLVRRRRRRRAPRPSAPARG
jgi:hypothetical protein